MATFYKRPPYCLETKNNSAFDVGVTGKYFRRQSVIGLCIHISATK